jgi:hypothetical protein
VFDATLSDAARRKEKENFKRDKATINHDGCISVFGTRRLTINIATPMSDVSYMPPALSGFDGEIANPHSDRLKRGAAKE